LPAPARDSLQNLALTRGQAFYFSHRGLTVRIVIGFHWRTTLERSHEFEKTLHGIWFFEEFDCPELHRFHGERNVAVTGEDHHRWEMSRCRQRAQRLQAVATRHHDIEKNDVRIGRHARFDQRVPALENANVMAGVLQESSGRIPHCRIVIDDHHRPLNGLSTI
jgi:hypothetical protein